MGKYVQKVSPSPRPCTTNIQTSMLPSGSLSSFNPSTQPAFPSTSLEPTTSTSKTSTKTSTESEASDVSTTETFSLSETSFSTKGIITTDQISTATSDHTTQRVSTPEVTNASTVNTLYTTSYANVSAYKNVCWCDICYGTHNWTTREPMILQVQRVDPKNTSKYRRTLISASDGRLSATVTGCVGSAILVGLILGVVVLDIDNIVFMFKMMKKNITNRCLVKKARVNKTVQC